MDRQKKAATAGNRRGSDRRGRDSRQGHSTAARRIESAETQRERLLAYLMERGHVSTAEARGGELRIMHPGGRVLELRDEGYLILTQWDRRQGCGRYFLLGGGGHGE
jgi:hypothetical protein